MSILVVGPYGSGKKTLHLPKNVEIINHIDTTLTPMEQYKLSIQMNTAPKYMTALSLDNVIKYIQYKSTIIYTKSFTDSEITELLNLQDHPYQKDILKNSNGNIRVATNYHVYYNVLRSLE
jgi:hypothetical protein